MAGGNEAIGGGGFHHVAIRVAGFEEAVRFYTEGLGMVEKVRWGQGDGRAVMLDTGDGNYVEIFAGGDGEAGKGAILHYALRTGDVDAAIERARAAGAEVTMEPRDVAIPSDPALPVRSAFCKAPGGEVIAFFHERS